jgi:dihydrofolate reductase
MEKTTGELGTKINAMPKYVVSGALQSADWRNSTVIPPDGAIDEIRRLKDRYEGDVLVNGSGQLARALLKAGLVDECRLMVFPVVLGSGKRLFDGVEAPLALEVADTRRAGDTLIVTYRPK